MTRTGRQEFVLARVIHEAFSIFRGIRHSDAENQDTASAIFVALNTASIFPSTLPDNLATCVLRADRR
jgi:hypothetical protein